MFSFSSFSFEYALNERTIEKLLLSIKYQYVAYFRILIFNCYYRCLAYKMNIVFKQVVMTVVNVIDALMNICFKIMTKSVFLNVYLIIL